MEDYQIVIPNKIPLSFQLMQQGQYEDAVDLLLTEYDELPLFLKALDTALSINKEHAIKIGDRNFFQRLVSSNTTDLANVIYEQNILMSAFYMMLLFQNRKTEDSQRLLTRMYTIVKENEQTTGKEQSNIQKTIYKVLKNEVESRQRTNLSIKIAIGMSALSFIGMVLSFLL